jgi:hypothetical protein
MADDRHRGEREPAPPEPAAAPIPPPPPVVTPPDEGREADDEIREGGYLPGESDEEY